MKYIVFLSLFLSITGCSTTYTITSKPSGANVFFKHRPIGTTPALLRTKNAFGRDLDVMLMKEGYKTINTVLSSDGGVINFDLKKINLDENKKDPSSFLRTLNPKWTVISIKDNITYNESWSKLISIFTKNFDIAIMDQNSGYVRSNWSYTSTGVETVDYKIRATAKFNVERSVVEIKTEANFLYNEQWVQGTDTDTLKTLQTDIISIIGNI